MSIAYHPAAKGTVVYVEDQQVHVLLMQAVFIRRPDLRLLVATTGQEALALAEGLRPDLLLLDIRLPDCLGTELLPRLRRLRRLPGCREAPAVAVTAEHHFRTEGTGFVEVWSKPLRLQQALSRLAALLPAEHMSVEADKLVARVEWQRAAAVQAWR